MAVQLDPSILRAPHAAAARLTKGQKSDTDPIVLTKAMWYNSFADLVQHDAPVGDRMDAFRSVFQKVEPYAVTPLTKKAMNISFNAQKNQVDKSGAPYVYRPFHPAEQMKDESPINDPLTSQDHPGRMSAFVRDRRLRVQEEMKKIFREYRKGGSEDADSNHQKRYNKNRM